MPNCVGCGAAAAIDGDPTTAWQTPFTDVRGQSLTYDLDAPLTFDRLDLTVFADGRHSVPRRLRLEVDGAVRELTLPEIGDQAGENATVTVPLTFEPVTGSRVRVVVDDIREATTFNYYANASSLLPVAIAELGVPGLVEPASAGALEGECRTDLLTIDGEAVPVRLTGTVPDAVAGDPLAIEMSAPAVDLDAGSHEVVAAPGIDTGVQIDRLVLASDAGGEPLAVDGGQVTGLPATSPPVPEVTVVSDGRTRMRLRVDGATEPFWLVLGQSASEGWTASTDGAEVGERRLVDGYANGWLVDPDSESFEVVLEWTPQRRVWAALGLSLLGVIGCAVIVAFTWWRRRGGKLSAVTAPDPDDRAHEARVAAGRAGSASLATRTRAGAARCGIAGRSGSDAMGGSRRRAVRRLRPTLTRGPARPAPRTADVGRTGRRLHRVEPAPLRHPARLRVADPLPRARTLAWTALLLAVAAAIVDLLKNKDDASLSRKDYG